MTAMTEGSPDWDATTSSEPSTSSSEHSSSYGALIAPVQKRKNSKVNWPLPRTHESEVVEVGSDAVAVFDLDGRLHALSSLSEARMG